MATLLGWNWSALRARVHRWRDCGLALIVAAVLLAGTVDAHAQRVGCGSMPGQMCISSDGPISVGVRQTADSVPSVNGNTMAIATTLGVTVALSGVAVAATVLPMGRVLNVGAQAVGAGVRAAIRNGMIRDTALVALLAVLGGDMSMSPDGTVSMVQWNPNQSDSGFDGALWISGNKTGNSAVAACSAYVAVAYPGMTITGYGGNGYCTGTLPSGSSMSCGGGVCNIAVGHAGGCVSGYVASGSGCAPDPNAPVTYVPATDAQIENAITAHPASWPQAFNAAGCGKATSYADFADPTDPCAVIIGGSVPQSNGVTWPGGNTASFPPRTTSTSGTDAQGNPTTTNTTTTTSATLSGTGSRTQPVSATPTQTTTTVTNRTNPDGSTTSTTTTSTTTSPDQSSTDDQAATFNGPDIQLYKAKAKTFTDVLQGFRTRVAAMPWYAATVGFFTVTIAGGSCPHWTVPATRWSQPLDASPYFCSSTAMTLYQLGGVVVMIVAAWAAFRIGLL